MFVGLVVAGYLASVLVVQPSTAAIIVAEALATYWLARGLAYGISPSSPRVASGCSVEAAPMTRQLPSSSSVHGPCGARALDVRPDSPPRVRVARRAREDSVACAQADAAAGGGLAGAHHHGGSGELDRWRRRPAGPTCTWPPPSPPSGSPGTRPGRAAPAPPGRIRTRWPPPAAPASQGRAAAHPRRRRCGG